MIRPALILAAFAATAHAQTATVDPNPRGAAYATLHVYNGGSHQLEEVRTVETELGPVTFAFRATPNYPCRGATPFPPEHCADHVEVIDLPDGVMADPIAADVLEGDTLVIHLIEYAGM